MKKLTKSVLAIVLSSSFALASAQEKKKDSIRETSIDEVVIVGYSKKVTKENYVGTATKVDSESIQKKNVSNVSQALAGESAGVRIINTSGQPGQGATIRIRGFGSVNGNRNPLYVLDGMPFTGDIASINPQDIESVTILKDATATAIYGARGANGVVVVNTKKGSSRKSYVQIESKVGYNMSLLPRYDVIKSPEQFIELGWEALYNKGKIEEGLNDAGAINFANARLFSDEGIGANYNMWDVAGPDLIDPLTGKIKSGVSRKYNPEDWGDYAFQTSVRTENNFSLSGGSKNNTYYAGIGYLKDEGYSINSDYQRYSGRLNLTHKVKPWLNGSFNMSYAYSKTNNNGQTSDSGNVFWVVDNMPSIFPLFLRDANGNKISDPYFGGYQFDYGESGRGFSALTNAVADATYNKSLTIGHDVSANMFLSASFLDGFSFDTRIGGQYSNSSYNNLRNPFYGGSATQGGYIFKRKQELLNWNFLQMLRYEKNIGNHGINAFVAHENNSYELGNLSVSKNNLIDPSTGEFNNAINQENAYSYILGYNLESYFGQVSYDYMNKYFLTGSVRNDGSSRFKESNKRWDTFGSLGLGWIISREDWFNVKPINLLKFKASYGTVGDQSGIGFYPGFNVYKPLNFMGDIATMYDKTGYPDLTWEKSNMFQTGLEITMFERALEATFDYYHKTTDNLIFDRRVAPSSGIAIEKVNDGVLVNQGFEFDVKAHLFKSNRNFFLDLGINGETLKNEITEMPIDPSTGKQKVIDLSELGFGRAVGRSIYDFYMRDYVGVNPQTGAAQWVMHYVDVNANGIYDLDEEIKSLHQYMIENPNAVIKEGVTEVYSRATQKFLDKSIVPDVRGAFNLSTGYKGFSVGVQLLYSFGGYSYDSSYAALMHNKQIGGNNWHKDVLDRWQKPGDITNVPRLSSGAGTDGNFTSLSSRFLTKSDYIALNNVKIGYDFSKSVIRDYGLEGLGLFLTGDNLWLYSERQGFNPSTSETGDSSSYRYSPLSTFTFGVNVKF